ncbi:MAG: hypothetical protein ACFFEU_08170 [Candidatus Thorarchaeota archaeon]|jgi:hypothetical protein
MQSPEIILSNELFTVAIILWVGTFSLLFWLFIRMNGLNKTIAMLSSASGQNVGLPRMPNKVIVFVALILELVGVAALIAGLFLWVPIPLFPMAIVVWAGVFIILLWQMFGIAGIEESVALLVGDANME